MDILHLSIIPITTRFREADPRTPISNARKIAAALGPFARLLEQDGFGVRVKINSLLLAQCDIMLYPAYILS